MTSFPSLLAVFATGLVLLTRGQRTNRLFKCPEQFGYFADEEDCSKYFMCVFGDSMHERCPTGLFFSTSLSMCDWQRNVKDCGGGDSVTARPSSSRATASNFRQSTSGGRFGQAISVKRVSTVAVPPPTRPAVYRPPPSYPPRNATYYAPITRATTVRRPSLRPTAPPPATYTTRSPGKPTPREGVSFRPFYIRVTTALPERSDARPLRVYSKRVRDPESERGENDPDYDDDGGDDDSDLSIYVKPLYVVNGTSGRFVTYGQRPAPQPPVRVSAPVVAARRTQYSSAPSRTAPEPAPNRGRPSQSLYGEESLNTHRHTIPSAAATPSRRGSYPYATPSSREPYSYDDNDDGDDYYDEEYYDDYDDEADDEAPQPVPTTPRSRFPIRVQQPTPRGFTTTTRRTTTTSTTTTTRRPPPPPPPPVMRRTTTTTTTTKRPVTQSSNAALSRGRSLPFGISRPATKPPSQLNKGPPKPPSRPESLYPTPRPLVTADKCDAKKCRLPDCRCGSSDIPGGLRANEVPQIVLITFDDAVNELNYETYAELFDGRKNPNGCPVLGTLYVSHEWTDYGMVQTLYSKGHEMASHSITHSFGEKFTKSHWKKEIHGQREILHLYGGVKLEDVRGMRAPFLQVGGNNMYEMLYESNFTYDSSLPVLDNNPPYFPYTMDYALNHECMIPPCPTKSFPGLWEVGMVMWYDYRGGRCSMGDACHNPDDAEGVFQMLLKNFNRHYNSNRAPFGLYYHAAWFTTQHYRRGYMRFIEEINKKNDVYMITNWQMLQWMRDPTPLSRIKDFEPWQCNKDLGRPDPCNHPTVCNIGYKGTNRNLKTCQPCPSVFPWFGKTGFDERYGSSEQRL